MPDGTLLQPIPVPGYIFTGTGGEQVAENQDLGSGSWAHCHLTLGAPSDPGGTATWQDAEDNCVAAGGHLASVHSQSDQDSMAALITNTAWFGYTDAADQGSFVWVDGSPSDYTNWAGGEPNDWGLDQCAPNCDGVEDEVSRPHTSSPHLILT